MNLMYIHYLYMLLDHKLYKRLLSQITENFLYHINFQPNKTRGQRWNYFADKEINYPTWAFNCMIRFLKFQKERVEKEEIHEQH